jgi:hypothetical protein
VYSLAYVPTHSLELSLMEKYRAEKLKDSYKGKNAEIEGSMVSISLIDLYQ